MFKMMEGRNGHVAFFHDDLVYFYDQLLTAYNNEFSQLKEIRKILMKGTSK